MTEDRLPLADLLAKAGDGDFLRSVAEAVGYDNGLWPICADEFWPNFRSMIVWRGPWARTSR